MTAIAASGHNISPNLPKMQQNIYVKFPVNRFTGRFVGDI